MAGARSSALVHMPGHAPFLGTPDRRELAAMRLSVGVPLTHPSLLLSDLRDTGTVNRFPTQRVYQETTDEINRNTAVFTGAETHKSGNPMCQQNNLTGSRQRKDTCGIQTALPTSLSAVKWLSPILTKT